MQQIDSKELTVILAELEKALASDGDVVEFGCYEGETSVEMARVMRKCSPSKKLYLYDSFEGLPEKSERDRSGAGEQFKAGGLKASKAGVLKRFRQAGLALPIVKKAWFSELGASDVPEKICFAFLDGDYYESIRDSLKLVEDRMCHGGVIVVDDYQSEALPGSARAVDEWLARYPHRMRVEASLAIVSYDTMRK